MEKKNIKIKKLNNSIKKILSKEIKNNICTKKDIITITDVAISPDFSFCKIFISTFKKNYDIIDILNKSSKKFRHHLLIKIKIRKIPKILFLYDKHFINN